MKRDEDGDIVAFERGDVVWGVDPFKRASVEDDRRTGEDGGVVPRPWLVLSTDAVPFHPEQYLCVTLTTRTWHDDSIPLSADDWMAGGAPDDSAVMPWSVSAVRHRFLDTTGELLRRLDDPPGDDPPVDGYQGRLTSSVVDQTTRTLVGYLEDSTR